MAFDTQNERMAVMNVGCPWKPSLHPLADTAFGNEDRLQLLYYTWTDTQGAAPPVTEFNIYIPTFRPRRR